MIKVQILTQCKHCNGEAYQPVGESEDSGHFLYIEETDKFVATVRNWLARLDK